MRIKYIFKNYSWILRALLPSLYFCIRKLPFKQALKIPILLYKPKFVNLSGKFIIHGEIKFGMITLGRNLVTIFPNDGISIDNKGIIIFEGKAKIGNSSFISCGPNGKLTIGEGVTATCAIKLICYNKINLNNNVIIGWNNMICDNDFHRLVYLNEKDKSMDNKVHSTGEITIGEGTWLGNGCKVYKNVHIPSFCVIGADTILNKNITKIPYSLICTDKKNVIKREQVCLDRTSI